MLVIAYRYIFQTSIPSKCAEKVRTKINAAKALLAFSDAIKAVRRYNPTEIATMAGPSMMWIISHSFFNIGPYLVLKIAF